MVGGVVLILLFSAALLSNLVQPLMALGDARANWTKCTASVVYVGTTLLNEPRGQNRNRQVVVYRYSANGKERLSDSWHPLEKFADSYFNKADYLEIAKNLKAGDVIDCRYDSSAPNNVAINFDLPNKTVAIATSMIVPLIIGMVLVVNGRLAFVRARRVTQMMEKSHNKSR